MYRRITLGPLFYLFELFSCRYHLQALQSEEEKTPNETMEQGEGDPDTEEPPSMHIEE
jgi:hypothetical protein